MVGSRNSQHTSCHVISGLRGSAAIGHVALGKLPPLHRAQVSPGDPVEMQLLIQQAWDGSEALSDQPVFLMCGLADAAGPWTITLIPLAQS